MKRIFAILFAFVLVLGALATQPHVARAETEREFDLVNVLDDLQSSKDEKGNGFDLTDYP